MFSKGKILLLGLGLAAVASAATLAAKVNVTLAGKALTLDAVTVKGRTYVALDQLKAGLNAAGGANAIRASEGGVGDALFDGVWRLTVLSVARSADDQSWDVRLRVGNGTKGARSMGDSAINNFRPHEAFHITTESGNTITATTGEAVSIQNNLTMKSLPPGASSIGTVRFYGPADDKPVKFILEIKPEKGLPYTKDPSFRVDLTKTKEG